MRALILGVLFPTFALAEVPKWRDSGSIDGFPIELREVEGSHYDEIRITATSDEPLGRVCEVIFGKNASEKGEGNFKKRELLKATETERWSYEQLALPVVSDRDYVIHVKIEQPPETGRCEVSFQTEDAPDRPSPPGFVRIKSVRGFWTVTPTDGGKLKIVYQVHSDPGGAVPPFLARGPQRGAAVDILKTILRRAKTPPPVKPDEVAK